MQKYKLDELPNNVVIKGIFDNSCKVSLSNIALDAIIRGKLKLKIIQHGSNASIAGFKATICSLSGYIQIKVGNNDSTVHFGDRSKGAYDIRLWRNSHVVIGEKTTSNGVRIVCDNSEFTCGSDCMFSDDILIQTSDQHGIVDLSSGEIINSDYCKVTLGEHVWLGRQSTLSSRINIGSGSVIGTGSLVTKDIEANCIAAGVPAKIIKTNHSWCRSPVMLDEYSEKQLKKK